MLLLYFDYLRIQKIVRSFYLHLDLELHWNTISERRSWNARARFIKVSASSSWENSENVQKYSERFISGKIHQLCNKTLLFPLVFLLPNQKPTLPQNKNNIKHIKWIWSAALRSGVFVGCYTWILLRSQPIQVWLSRKSF